MNNLTKKWNNLSTRQQTLIVFAFFAVLIAVFYGNALGNGFIGDDIGQIQENEYMRSLKNFPDIFTGRMIERLYAGYDPPITYRATHFVSLMLTAQISSEPWVFHLVILIYFFLAAILIFILIRLLTHNFSLSLLTALFFIIHPIQNSVVNHIYTVPELTITIFALLTIIAYIHYRQKASTARFAAVYIFYFFALISKEPAVLLPILILALDVLFFNMPLKDSIRGRALKRYLFFGVPFVLYLIARGGFFGGGDQYGNLIFIERIDAFVRLFGQYISKIFYPYPLSVYYAFEKSADLMTASFAISLLALIVFVGAVVVSYRRGKKLFVFFLIWFVLFLLPVLLFYGGRGSDFFAERYLFLPSIAFSFLAAYLFVHFFHYSQRSKVITLSVLIFFVIVSWVVVFPTNREWKNDFTLYSATIQKVPNAHLLRWRVAEIAFQQGDIEHSKEQYEYLIDNASDWREITKAYKGMGDYYIATGDKEKALEYYVQSAALGYSAPDYVPHNLAGLLYMEKEDYLTAFTYFCTSMQLFPTEQTQQSRDASLAAIDETITQKGTLTPTIIEQFEPSPNQNIAFVGNRCTTDTCEHAFAFNAQSFEIIPPFLITATTPHAWKQNTTVPVEITNLGFDQENNVIILETDASYEDAELTFLFPTCGRTYYSVTTE